MKVFVLLIEISQTEGIYTHTRGVSASLKGAEVLMANSIQQESIPSYGKYYKQKDVFYIIQESELESALVDKEHYYDCDGKAGQ